VDFVLFNFADLFLAQTATLHTKVENVENQSFLIKILILQQMKIKAES